jgi:hypothetical protein
MEMFWKPKRMLLTREPQAEIAPAAQVGLYQCYNSLLVGEELNLAKPFVRDIGV